MAGRVFQRKEQPQFEDRDQADDIRLQFGLSGKQWSEGGALAILQSHGLLCNNTFYDNVVQGGRM
jgi:hypothetical protein